MNLWLAYGEIDYEFCDVLGIAESREDAVAICGRVLETKYGETPYDRHWVQHWWTEDGRQVSGERETP